jgi:hypothetical protein
MLGVTATGNTNACEKKGVARHRGRAGGESNSRTPRGSGQASMKTKGGQSLPHRGTNPQREKSTRGYHPRGDRKSAEAIEKRRDNGAPLRKRVRNRMKLQGLQGCDRKEKT